MNHKIITLMGERRKGLVSNTVRLILITLMIICSTGSLFAQSSGEISGFVSDQKGEPLIGVTILIKNTSTGTITNIDGSYTIKASAGATLEFTYLGYKTKTAKVGDSKTLDLVMEEDTQKIDEVVVVGYGKQRKATLTGAVSTINTSDLTVSTTANAKDLLAGKLPGVRVQQQSGEPGSYSSKMDIRGLGSPLIVIDGVIRDEAAFQRLEPNEIETVSVLKDAAAAVYGMRAANGAVIVTTRRGSDSKTKIEYSGSVGVQNPSGLPEVLNAWQYATLVRESDKNMGRGIDATYTAADVERLKNEGGTDWQDLVMRNLAMQTHHNITASGRSEKADYFLSLGYYAEDGIWKSGDLNYKRYNLRSNLGFEITKGLKADVLLNGTFDNKNQPYKDTWEQFKSLWMLKPTETPYANDNSSYLSNVMYGLNPLATTDADLSGYKKASNQIFNGSLSLTYDIPFVKGLQAKAMYSYDYKTSQNKNFQKAYTLYDYDSGSYNSATYNSPSSIYRKTWNSNQSMFQGSLNYEMSINKEHNLKFLALYEQSAASQDNFYGSSYLDMDAVDEMYAGVKNDQEASSDIGQIWDQKNAGIIGRINYDYLSKYLLEFSFRYDGSSKFAPGHRWGFFPAVSGGYRISEESFIRENEALSFISNLKFRASYGVMGDDSSSSYQYLTGYEYPNTGSSSIFGGSAYSGLTFKALANENLTWFKSKTFNLGTDLDLWNGLLSAQVDFFWRYRSGLFASRSSQIPGTFGAEFPEENLNEDMHKGFEIVLTHRNKIGDFDYSVSGNFAITRSKWRNRAESSYKNSYDRWRNSYIDRYNDLGWAYGSNGQFTSMQDIWNAAIQDGLGGSTQLPGDWKYEDWNGDGIIDDNDMYPNTYQHVDDSGNPKMTFGSTITAAWKGFDVNILLQGGAGFNVVYFEQLQYPLCFGGNGLAYFFDRYHQDENGNWIAGKWPTTRDPGSFAVNYVRAKQTTYDASYLRIKSAEIGYTLPSAMTKNWGVERLRVSVSGYNLATFSNLDFVDPEHPSGAYGYLYPIMRNFNFGVNVTF